MGYSLECVYCGRAILKADRIGDPEAVKVVAHLRREHPHVLDKGSPPTFADMLKYVRVRMA